MILGRGFFAPPSPALPPAGPGEVLAMTPEELRSALDGASNASSDEPIWTNSADWFACVTLPCVLGLLAALGVAPPQSLSPRLRMSITLTSCAFGSPPPPTNKRLLEGFMAPEPPMDLESNSRRLELDAEQTSDDEGSVKKRERATTSSCRAA